MRRVDSSFDGDGIGDFEKIARRDCDSAQTGERAIGGIIPTKLANNSRKEARIAISEDLTFALRIARIVNGPCGGGARSR